MKKLLILGIFVLTVGISAFAKVKPDCETINTPCGYFTGTGTECDEFRNVICG